jgi:hypothetical protein
MIVRLDGKKLTDTAGLMAALGDALGFAVKNRDALVDALTHLDDLRSCGAIVFPGEVVLLAVEGTTKIAGQLAEIAAFVNWRRLEKGQPPIVALAYEP